MRLVLASSSPRRRELLARLGFEFEVVPPEVDEDGAVTASARALARRLAREKALDVAARRPHEAVLAADTVVVLRGEVLGKPRDAAEARETLARLRGRTHRVITGVTLCVPGRRLLSAQVVTRVRMRTYGAEEVEVYIASGDAFDKAGAYAIQDERFHPVEAYAGCYCNVVGLPLWTALRLLSAAGLQPPGAPDMLPACAACPERPSV
ncbi:MAG TPA: Maf family protein [Dehalococcoidia bacterium]|nr:Maf family protein [Dehalococcoidia bacterium]